MKQTLVVDCDRCHTWFHACCIGLSRETIPDEWYCDACQLTRIIEQEQRQHNLVVSPSSAHNNDQNDTSNPSPGGMNNKKSIVDKNFAMHRVLESHLYQVSTGRVGAGKYDDYEDDDEGYTIALQFFLAKWVEDLYQKSNNSQAAVLGDDRPHDAQEIQTVIAHLLDRWDDVGGNSSDNDISSSAAGAANSQQAGGVGGHSCCALTEEGNVRTALSFRATGSDFVISFRNHLGLMLKVMSDKSAANLRKLSVKAIEKVVDADPKLMLLQIVMKAVSERFSDEAISVREAVVALVGNYVVQSPAVANAFHASFLPRLMDPGVSVRKRTVRILQDILCSNPQYKGRIAACNLLLQRAADPKEDDGVRDAIHDLFLTLWLKDGNVCVPFQDETNNDEDSNKKTTTVSSEKGDLVVTSPTAKNAESQNPHNDTNRQRRDSGSGAVITPESPSCLRTKNGSRTIRKNKLRSEFAAEQMIEVVQIANTAEHLGLFMKELLSETSDVDKSRKVSERKRRQKIAKKQCFRLVDTLFDQLLSAEEENSNSQNHHHHQNAPMPLSLQHVSGKKVIATMRTIGVFTKFSPTSVVRHLDTVLPYLKADNGFTKEDESAIVTAASDILYLLCSVLDQNDIEHLNADGGRGRGVSNDLIQITYNFGSEAIFSAVRAFSALAHHKDLDGEASIFGKQLLNLCRTFYTYLYKRASDDISTVSPKVMNNIQRGLSVLGVLCRHHETPIDSSLWDEEVEIYHQKQIKLFDPKELCWKNVSIGCYRLFSKYLSKQQHVIKCSALRALGGIFAAHPRLLLAMEQSGLIDDVMSEHAHIDLKRESLRCWRDILLAEEKRVESGDAKAKMDSNEDITTSKKISGDQDSDATIVGGVLTKHASRLFELTQSKYQELRFAALDLIGQLLRQGMVNPNEAVPYLFALQGDVEDFSIRSLALRFLTLEGEKRPDMLRQRICDGVKQACMFQQQLYPKRVEISALVNVNKGTQVEVECVFDSVFRECIMNSQKQRHGLYRNLLGLFEKNESSNSGRKKKKSQQQQKEAAATNSGGSTGRRTPPRKAKRVTAVSSSFDLQLLSFASQILAYLPYNTSSDPLFIIYHITSIVALGGSQLLDRLATFLRPYGLSSSDEYDETNDREDILEKAAKTKEPMHSEEAKKHLSSSADFDWPEFCELCREASAMVLLLRLKHYLRKVYNLSGTRCFEYNPSDHQKDRSISAKVETSKPFNSSLMMMSGDVKNLVNKDAVICQYAEYRCLMRAENTSDTRMSGSDGGDDDDDDGDGAMTTKKNPRKRSSSTGSGNDPMEEYTS